MREILFRGKRIDNSKWVEGYLIHDEFCNVGIPYIGYLNWKGHSVDEVIPETVGQYIGITDKTGKKIFEGDIVKEYNIFGVEVGIGAVHWSDLFLAWHITKNKSMYSGNIASYEVIGNIHDNPELLKGGK